MEWRRLELLQRPEGSDDGTLRQSRIFTRAGREKKSLRDQNLYLEVVGFDLPSCLPLSLSLSLPFFLSLLNGFKSQVRTDFKILTYSMSFPPPNPEIQNFRGHPPSPSTSLITLFLGEYLMTSYYQEKVEGLGKILSSPPCRDCGTLRNSRTEIAQMIDYCSLMG